MDLTVYMDTFGAPRLGTAEQTSRYVNFWLDSGFTSVKAYEYTNSTALKTAIEIAHRRGVKLAGHICRIGYRQAADLGIDSLEHGFVMMPDLSASKAEELCSSWAVLNSLDGVDARGPKAKALIDHLVARKVAGTSTLVTMEDFIPDIPQQRGVELLTPPLREFHDGFRAKLKDPTSGLPTMQPGNLRKSAIMERDFMRASGLLVSGTDPCVPSMGVIAGFGTHGKWRSWWRTASPRWKPYAWRH